MENLNVLLWCGAAAVVILAFKAGDWIEARAEESHERARKAKLENDKAEFELQQLTNTTDQA
jgi:hypothetical protein